MGFETKKACEVIRSNTLQTQSSFHLVMSPSEAASQLGWNEWHGESGAGRFRNPQQGVAEVKDAASFASA